MKSLQVFNNKNFGEVRTIVQENGTIVPPIPKLELIAKALEIPLINLLSNDSLCS